MASAAPEAPRLYGRRKGRPLRVRKTALMQDLLPDLQISLPSGGMTAQPRDWFGRDYTALWLEIGFGGGEHLAAQAAAHPDIAMIGCEPFANGVASLLDHIDRQRLTNIRIHPGDARLLLGALPPASLAAAFILFADPWPKKRHAERRFVQPGSLALLARAMRPGAPLRLATDDPILQEWTAEQLQASPDFRPESGASIATVRPENWVPTRYEEKARQAGRVPFYYCFTRNDK